ncbi:MAG: hypothetical protein HC933_11420 [Pleurocapsa sp. SU_196_0]|nr:hypothetical protein [Pleurocapsa sp. SU_196_0]
MIRTSYLALAAAGFLVDSRTATAGTGGQIDWANVPASYLDSSSGKKFLPAGKVVVELASGKLVPHDSPAAAAATKAVLLTTSALEGEKEAALSGYGTVVAGERLREPVAGRCWWSASGAFRRAQNPLERWRTVDLQRPRRDEVSARWN